MQHNYLEITLGHDLADTYTLKFKLIDQPITTRWADKLLLAQALNYPIDNPKRFYGFNSWQEEIDKSLELINTDIRIINSYKQIIDRNLTDISDQDTLNYLHNIFERYHGLLNQQNTDFWYKAPEEVRKALSNLNNNVHRCESTTRGNQPRMVLTWYGLPKVSKLEIGDYALKTDTYTFGTMYLNYVEIGKTLEDLHNDNDVYIGDDAFKPFKHFSADITIRFWDSKISDVECHRKNVKDYFNSNFAFFKSKGYTEFDNQLAPGLLPIAQLEYTDKEQVLENIQKRQNILKVSLIS